jgi:hypothetical protein
MLLLKVEYKRKIKNIKLKCLFCQNKSHQVKAIIAQKLNTAFDMTQEFSREFQCHSDRLFKV